MNKSLLMLLVAATVSSGLLANSVTSHTFFSRHPQFQNGSPEHLTCFRPYIMDARVGGHGGAWQAVVYGGKTTQPQEIAKFFLPWNKTCLNVVEFKQADPVVTPDNDPLKDIEARNFNIETINSTIDDGLANTFKSTICFCPHQSVVGLGLDFKQAIWWDDDYIRFFFEASAPIEHVRNSMGLSEIVTSTGGGVDPVIGLDNSPRVANMVQAFNQCNWRFGRIPHCSKELETTRLGDCEFKLGWNSLIYDHCHYNNYVGIIIPAGNRPKGRVVFEPVVGNNHHFGLMYGSNLGFDVWDCGSHDFDFEFDINGRYLFRNHQVRSFDLRDKSWSRYLAVYANVEAAEAAAIAPAPIDTNAGTSGINVFTRCVKVSPRFQFVLNSALLYRYCNWFEAEVGYGFFARHGEKVTLDCWNNNDGPQVMDISGLGNTNTARTIKNNYEGSAIPLADYQPLTLCDLNLDSAAHPAVLSNTIYAFFAGKYDICGFPMCTGVGGSYEFSSFNLALDRWNVWGKFVMSY